MKFNYKVWIENDKKLKIFGSGPAMLLKKTAELGSLRKAALEMNMAYSKAFFLINNSENELGIKLLIRKIGGKHGGGSIITEEAKELILKYEEFDRRASKAIEDIYNEIF